MKKYSVCLSLFSIIYLVLSLIIYSAVPAINSHMEVDSIGYEQQALDTTKHDDISFHTKGYPYFLALINTLFGYSRALVILIQIILALLSGFLLFSIAHKLFNQTIALISFALFSFNLGFLIFPQFILAEMLLIFLLLFAFERLVTFITRGSPFALAASGMLWGISIIVKPVAIYYIVFLLSLLLFKKSELKHIVMFTACFFTPVVGYMTINKATYGKFSISPLVNANLYIWFHAKIQAAQKGTTHIEEMKYLNAPSGKNMLNKANWKPIKEAFFTLIKQNPFFAIKVWMRDVMKTFLGLYTTNLKVLLEPKTKNRDLSFFRIKKQSVWQKAIHYVTAGTNSLTIKIVGFFEVFYNLLRYLLIFIALMALCHQQKWYVLSLCSSYVFYFSMITGHDGCARYRFMFEFIFIMLTALALYSLWKRFAFRRVNE